MERRSGKLGEETIKKIVELHEKGESRSTLALRFGLSLGGVSYWLKRKGMRGGGEEKDVVETDYGCRKCGFRTTEPRVWGMHVFECKKIKQTNPMDGTRVWG